MHWKRHSNSLHISSILWTARWWIPRILYVRHKSNRRNALNRKNAREHFSWISPSNKTFGIWHNQHQLEMLQVSSWNERRRCKINQNQRKKVSKNFLLHSLLLECRPGDFVQSQQSRKQSSNSWDPFPCAFFKSSLTGTLLSCLISTTSNSSTRNSRKKNWVQESFMSTTTLNKRLMMTTTFVKMHWVRVEKFRLTPWASSSNMSREGRDNFDYLTYLRCERIESKRKRRKSFNFSTMISLMIRHDFVWRVRLSQNFYYRVISDIESEISRKIYIYMFTVMDNYH